MRAVVLALRPVLARPTVRLAVQVTALAPRRQTRQLRLLQTATTLPSSSFSALLSVLASFVPEGCSATSMPSGEFAALSASLSTAAASGLLSALLQSAAANVSSSASASAFTSASALTSLSALLGASVASVDDISFSLFTTTAEPSGQPTRAPSMSPSLQRYSVPAYSAGRSVGLVALAVGVGLLGLCLATYCAVTHARALGFGNKVAPEEGEDGVGKGRGRGSDGQALRRLASIAPAPEQEDEPVPPQLLPLPPPPLSPPRFFSFPSLPLLGTPKQAAASPARPSRSEALSDAAWGAAGAHEGFSWLRLSSDELRMHDARTARSGAGAQAGADASLERDVLGDVGKPIETHSRPGTCDTAPDHGGDDHYDQLHRQHSSSSLSSASSVQSSSLPIDSGAQAEENRNTRQQLRSTEPAPRPRQKPLSLGSPSPPLPMPLPMPMPTSSSSSSRVPAAAAARAVAAGTIDPSGDIDMHEMAALVAAALRSRPAK